MGISASVSASGSEIGRERSIAIVFIVFDIKLILLLALQALSRRASYSEETTSYLWMKHNS